GPRISFAAATSRFVATWTRASAACFAVSNCFCPGCSVLCASCGFAAVSFFSGAAIKPVARKLVVRIAAASPIIFDDVMVFRFVFIFFLHRFWAYLRRPPPPPRPPPPLPPPPPRPPPPRLIPPPPRPPPPPRLIEWPPPPRLIPPPPMLL